VYIVDGEAKLGENLAGRGRHAGFALHHQNRHRSLSRRTSAGLAINGIELFDTDGVPTSPSALLKTPGSIYIGSIAMTDTGGTDLTVSADIDVSAAGLVLTSTGGLMDVRISDVRLGNVDTTALHGPNTTKSLGDIELVGVNATGTQLIISGH